MNQFTLFAVVAFFSSSVLAQEMTVVMTDLSSGQSVGTVTVTDSEYGTVFTPQLTGLPMRFARFSCTRMAHVKPRPKMAKPY